MKFTKTFITSLLLASSSIAHGASLQIISASDWGGSHSSYPATKAIDGNTNWSSRWAASGSPVNLQLDLNGIQQVSALGIAWGKGKEQQHEFEVWARQATSGSWTKVYDGMSSGSSASIEYVDVNDIDARQVRIKTFSNTANSSWTNIKEVEVYSSESASAPSAGNTPSENFQLSQWKITLPVSKSGYFGSGGSSAAEVLPGNCNDYSVTSLDDGFEDSQYFYTASDGAMAFVTPLEGGASTPSSSYVRSELRELYNWTPCGSDSTANWTIAGTHSLAASLKVVDYYSDDPQTVVGQIHAKDSSKALLKLQWDGPDKKIRAIINENPTTGNPFSLTFDAIPGSNQWSYLIRQTGDTLAITVTYNGTSQTQSVRFGDGNMSTDWRDHEYYFKAGNYAQAGKDTGGRFEVRFYKLDVVHSN